MKRGDKVNILNAEVVRIYPSDEAGRPDFVMLSIGVSHILVPVDRVTLRVSQRQL